MALRSARGLAFGAGAARTLGTLAALDLTTSLIPSPADHLWPIPAKPTALLVLEVVCALALMPVLARGARAAWRALCAAPIPPVARVVLVAWAAVAALHVALRFEHFPFSPVAMFSSGVVPRQDDAVEVRGYLVQHGDTLVPLSFLREGSGFGGRYGLDWDYKAGWAMSLYAYSHSRARDLLLRDLGARGFVAHRVRYRYDRHDGRPLPPEKPTP